MDFIQQLGVNRTFDRAIDPLISVTDLYELLRSQSEPPILIGVTPAWRFLARRLPGSHQVWRPALSQKRSARLVDARGFTAWARQLGLHDSSHVVLWDERYDASRLWWAFQHYGHRRVQVLDGGLQAWRQAGLPLAWGLSHRPAPHQGTWQARPGKRFPVASTVDILRSQTAFNCQLWDCRNHNEWSGRQRRRGAAKAGRIPWAKHLPWQLFRADKRQGSRFFHPETIAQVIAQHRMESCKQHFFYCQSGVRSTVAILALYRLGWSPEQLVNYDGSWVEWSHDPSLPALSESNPRRTWALAISRWLS